MDGILIVDKPKGLTSHDVVDFIRRRFHLKKVGHAGTLDPQATGVLVILIGKFTKKSGEFSAHDKEYEGCLTLGVATDTQDTEGQIIHQENVKELKLEQISQIFSQFLGKIEQIPPMFSALKIKGKKLYSLARKGIQINRLPRQVYIYKLTITEFVSPHIYFAVTCSKGTYIRSLCVDLANKLGYPGHLSQLRRVRSGSFTVTQSICWDKLREITLQKLDQILLHPKSKANEAD